MLNNFTFTLYEIFGYLVPGSVTLTGFAIIYWAAFNPTAQLWAGFDPGVGVWALLLSGCYILGHAAQAVGNKLFRQVEKKALEMKSNPLLRESAFQHAARIFDVDIKSLDARWVYRVLDELAVQNGQPGDRDMFIYREGFYRGTCVGLFFLALSLIVRAAVPGTVLKCTYWTLALSQRELVFTSLIVCGLGWLFFQRYCRFTEYRVTRAVLSALVLLQLPKDGNETEKAVTEK